MENILIQKAENGFVVYENYERAGMSVTPTSGKTLVFATKKALNNYINEKFKFEVNEN